MSPTGSGQDDLTPPRDTVLLSRAAEWLFTDHWADLVRCASNVLGGWDHAAAEDLAADVILLLLNGEFDRRNVPTESALAFTKAVIRNRAMHERRRSTRFLSVSTLRFHPPSQPTEHAVPETWIDLQRAMASLPSEQRRALQLYYIEGVSTSDIAAREQVSESAIRLRMHRARAALRKRLLKCLPEIV